MIDSVAAPSFFLLKKGIKLKTEKRNQTNTKKIMERKKEFVREVAEGDKHYLRKICKSQSTNQ